MLQLWLMIKFHPWREQYRSDSSLIRLAGGPGKAQTLSQFFQHMDWGIASVIELSSCPYIGLSFILGLLKIGINLWVLA